MALIALASASGSPGVTTSALALALTWPRPVVLVDADPTGARAIPAGYFRGGQLPVDTTIIDLAVSHRQGRLAEDLPRALMPIENSDVQLLNGPLHHNQARALDGLWDQLAAVFKLLDQRNGQDVIVDVGRLGLEGSALKLFTLADLAMLVTRTDLPALVAASSWAATLREEFENVGGTPSLQCLVVGENNPHSPYNAGDAQRVLKIPVVSALAWDPDSARVYSVGEQPRRRFDSSALSKSVRATAQASRQAVNRTRIQLAATGDRRTR